MSDPSGKQEAGAAFMTAMAQELRVPATAEKLKAASQAALLADWTDLLTQTVVQTCSRLSWRANAKGHENLHLPVRRKEYLSLDVMAFAGEVAREQWAYPVAVFELENSQRDELVAYAFWKMLMVRTRLRVLFCYRPEADALPALIRHLRASVVEAMDLTDRLSLTGEILIAAGSRAEAETFPYGFFRWWRLNSSTGMVERV